MRPLYQFLFFLFAAFYWFFTSLFHFSVVPVFFSILFLILVFMDAFLSLFLVLVFISWRFLRTFAKHILFSHCPFFSQMLLSYYIDLLFRYLLFNAILGMCSKYNACFYFYFFIFGHVLLFVSVSSFLVSSHALSGPSVFSFASRRNCLCGREWWFWFYFFLAGVQNIAFSCWFPLNVLICSSAAAPPYV